MTLAPRVAARFRDRPAPTILHEVAGRYGELSADIDARWRDKLDGLRQRGTPATTLGDRASDEVWEFPVGVARAERLRAGQPRLERAGGAAAILGGRTAGERKPLPDGTGRENLADAVADPKNPLTARVWVNRVWGHLFGVAPVTTPSDWKLPKGTEGAVAAGGGKTAADAAVALVCRWIAPADGAVRIDGELVAKSGGRATVVGAGGVIATWAGQSASVRTAVAKIAVKAGQPLDFFVEATPETPAADFDWGFTIEPVATPAMGTMIWNSAGHFDGPPPKSQAALTAKQQFAQILLLSNEFSTVD